MLRSQPFDGADDAPDLGDVDALREMERARGWLLLKARVESEIERQRSALESPLDAQLTAEVRGQIKALRMVLELPEILRAEIDVAQ